MTHKKFLAGILALALIFGMTLIGCEMATGGGGGGINNGNNNNNNGGNNADPALIGTWRASQEIYMGEGTPQIMKYDWVIKSDGSLEYSILTPFTTPVSKGTYTTSGDQFIYTVTAAYGSYPGAVTNFLGGGFEVFEFEDRYYTKDEYKTAYLAAYRKFLEENTGDEFDEEMYNRLSASIDASFKPVPYTYKINGNELTLTMTAETMRKMYEDMGYTAEMINEIEKLEPIKDFVVVFTRQQ